MNRAAAAWLDAVTDGSESERARLRALQSEGLPDARNEHWAHAHLAAFADVRQLAPVPAAEATGAAAALALPPVLPGAARLVFVDGHLQASLSDPAALQHCEWLAHDAVPMDFADPDLRYATLGTVHAGNTLRCQLPSGADATLEALHVFSGAAGSVYPRLRLQLDGGATLTLVERFTGDLAAGTLLCTALDVRVGADARLRLHRLHECGPRTLLLDQLQLQLDAGAQCRVHQLSVGGATARQSQSAQLDGRGASLQFHAASVQRANEYHDLLVRVRLGAPECAIEHRYRALAADRAHVACSADVIVEAAARGARVRQSLRGLNDGRGSHLNLRPRLTIHTDEVQASHGATTGQLDETLLLYLLSRGIAADTARAMLKWAFLGDVFSAIDAAPLRRAAEEVAARHVADQGMHQLVGSLLS
jgi:Fe-S cluster assembly protein SufD